MDTETILSLWKTWDAMDRAAAAVTTALPAQLTERVAALDAARLEMRRVMQFASLRQVRQV